jgi:hypothetical protein
MFELLERGGFKLRARWAQLLEDLAVRGKADRSVSAGQLRDSAAAILALEEEVARAVTELGSICPSSDSGGQAY